MLNRWQGIGRMKAKPELNKTNSGKACSTFVLAVQRDVSKQAEEGQVDWITCVAWDKDAETITKWFDKGDPIYVEGRLQTRTWEDMKKNLRTVLEVHVKKWYRMPKQRDKSPDIEPDVPAGSTPPRPTSNRQARFTEIEDDGDLPF